MEYGYFDNDDREYVITNPCTPTKWINYIGTLEFGGFVDQTGGALICRGDPALNRITKYIPQLPASYLNGEGLYLRFYDRDRYVIFSPYYIPTLTTFNHYETRVGLGYSRIISEMYGVRTEVTIFIPMDEQVLLRDIQIINCSRIPKTIDVIPVVEYTHPDALKQYTNADWIPQTMISRVIEEANGLKILTQYPFMLRDIRRNYFTSNYPVSSYESDRRIFLGDNGCRGWHNPKGLERGELSNSQANRGDNIAAILHHLGELKPGEGRRIITQLGQRDDIESITADVEKYRSEKEVEKAFQELAGFWHEYLSKMQVQTPDESMNQMINVHNPRQCLITKNWSRYLSLYQLGLGDRGIGFRDSSQDVLGVMSFIPKEAANLIRDLLSVQKRNGSAMHQFNPLSMEATMGEAGTWEGSPDYYSDDHLWIILAITAYLKETGDFVFLDEEIPFYEKDKKGQPIEVGTVFEHIKRAILFTQQDVGKHGLPLSGFADWNDTVNLRTGAESMFTACLYGVALLELIELGDHLGWIGQVEEWKKLHTEMKEAVNTHCWDGDWYIRYFDADGSPIGSKSNQQGKIFANAQSWTILAGYAEAAKGRVALDAVKKYLNTSNGIKLSMPGFDGFDPKKGGVSTYPPGAKENGGIFLHSNPWVMIAETYLGDGDQAFEYYNQINPVTKNNQIDVFECEPYVYPQNILGDEHPQFGLARNSWLTGTASWAYQAGTKYILGIKPRYDGLEISPCIPEHWEGFRIRRFLRDTIYEIEVIRDKGLSRGSKRYFVDGKELETGSIPYFQDGKVHSVEVLLGCERFPDGMHRSKHE
jgi:cellobiose phosphorylase